MSRMWWRKLAGERTKPIRRSALRVEHLEDRVTPAGILAIGSPAGVEPRVAVLDAATRAQTFALTPYDINFTGGVNVAVGDVNGDGTPDIVTGAGAGGGPVVKVFDGRNGAELRSITVGDDSSRAGVTVAVGDFNVDGNADIVAGGVRNGQPLVQVINFLDGAVIRGYTPFEGITGGVSVAVGDVNGDGTPDTVVGAGAGGTPRVTVFSGTDDSVLMNFLAFESSFTGGVKVSAGDVNDNGRADVTVAAGFLGGPRVQTFSGADGAVISNFFAYDSALRDGVSAVLVDSDGNKTLDIVTGNGTGQPLDPKAFVARTAAALAAPNLSGMPAAAGDLTGPTASVGSSAPTLTNTQPIPYKITFSKPVNGFDVTDLTLSNGTASNFVEVDAKNYTFGVTPTTDGVVSVAVAAGVAFDIYGNGNAAGTALTRTFDSSAPTLTVTNKTTNQTAPVIQGTTTDTGGAIQVKVGSGQPFPATISGNNWTAAVPSALAQGTYTVEATITDVAGNKSTATGTLVIDTTIPTATISTTAPNPTGTSPVPFKVAFSEDVQDFVQADLVVSAGTVGAFTKIDAKNYSFNVTLTANAVVNVSFAAGAASDLAGNLVTAPTPVSLTFNGAATTPVFETSATTPTNQSPIQFAVRFQNNVTGFDKTDLVLTNGVVSNFVATDAKTYTFSFTPAADGEIKIDIAAGAATDVANLPTAAANYTNTSDRTAPTATFTAPGATTASTPIDFAFTFAEEVLGEIINSEVQVANGALVSITRVNTTDFTIRVTPTAAGNVTLTVLAGAVTDRAGNPIAADLTKVVNFDPTFVDPPVVTGLDAASDSGTAGDGVTNDTTPAIVGTSLPNATVEVFEGANSLGTATASASGVWNFTPTTALAENVFSVTAKATVGGNTSAASGAFSLTIDTTPPAAPGVTGLDAGSDSGTPGDGITNDATPTLVGTAEANAKVEIFEGTNSLGVVTASGTGDWTFTPTTALAAGSYSVTAVATDKAGNAGPASTAITVRIDTVAPAAPVVTGIDPASDTGTLGDGITADDTPTLIGTAEANAKVEVFEGTNSLGTTTADGSGAWSFTPAAALANGSYTITAKATDVAANVSDSSAGVNIQIDTTTIPAAPVITGLDAGSDSGTAGDGITSDLTPTLVGTAVANATVTVFDGPTQLGTTTADGSGNWSFTPTADLSEGARSVTATATVGGTTGPASAAFNLTVDATPPAAPGVAGLAAGSDSGTPGDGITNVTSPTLTGTAEAGATVAVFDGPTLLGTATADGSGNWSYTVTTVLGDGTHTFTATATDAAGNVGPASAGVNVEIDATLPAAPTIALDPASDTGTPGDGITADDTPTLTGSAEPNATVSVYADSGPGAVLLGTATADGSGNWTFTVPSPLALGTYTFTATATDAAGNVGPASTGLVLDIVAPVIGP